MKHKGLTKSWTNAAVLTAAIVATPLAAAGATVSDVEANNVAATPASYQDIEIQARDAVRVRNSQKFGKDVVRTVTARASNDRIALAIFGADRDMLNQARVAVWEAQQRGIDIIGIVMGSRNEAKSYDVYGDGHRWAERTPEELLNSTDIRASILTSIEYADSGMRLLQAEKEQQTPATDDTPIVEPQ